MKSCFGLLFKRRTITLQDKNILILQHNTNLHGVYEIVDNTLWFSTYHIPHLRPKSIIRSKIGSVIYSFPQDLICSEHLFDIKIISTCFKKSLSFQLTWNEDSSEVWCHFYKKHNATICEIAFASQENKAVFCETNMQESSDIVVSYFLKAWLPGNTGAPGVIQNLSLKYIGKMCSTLFSTPPTMLWFVTSLCKHNQILI